MPSLSTDFLDNSIHQQAKRKRDGPMYDEVQMKLENSILRPTTEHIDSSRPILAPRHIRAHSQKKLRIDVSPPSHAAVLAHPYAASDVHMQRPGGIDLTPCYICHRKPTRKSDLDSFADCESCGKRSCYICIRQCDGPFVGSGNQHHHPTSKDSVWRSSNDVYSVSTAQQYLQQEGRERAAALHLPVPDRWSDELVSPKSTSHASAGHKKMVCSRCCVERGQDGEVWCLGCLMAAEDL